MKILNALAATGAVLLLATSPAGGQPGSSQASGAPIQLAPEGAFGAKKDEYLQKAKSEMQEWQQKMHDFGETAAAKGHEAATAARAGLHDAWANAKAEAREVEAATADGWERAKSAFEKATRSLRDAWHKSQLDSE
jgi:Spy/CpxP family protein refolding chaperone